MVRENGIELLEEIYEELWKYILENKEKINYKVPFDLFNEVDRYAIDAIKGMSPEKVQKYVRWDGLIEYIQRITFWIGYDEYNSKTELNNTYYFARYAGYYLSTNYDDKYEAHWNHVLERGFWTYTANIPEERIDDFLQARCIVKLNYIYGFIENGLDTLVINSFFIGSMAKIFRLEDKYEVLLGLCVHCFLYYASKRNMKAIASGMQNCAEKVILHGNVK